MTVRGEIVETRVIRWIARGYEDAFTQYQITSEGEVWICQISLRNNMARKMQNAPLRAYVNLPLTVAQDIVNALIENRLEADDEFGPMAEEVLL